MNLYKRQHEPASIVWPICLVAMLQSGGLHAESASRYRPMAESMMEMMDAFSSALQKKGQNYSGESGGNTSPWGAGNSIPWNPGGMPMSPSMSPWSMSPWSMSGVPMGNPMSPWSMGGMPMTPSMSPWSMGNLPLSQGGMPWSGQGVSPRAFAPHGSGNPFDWWPAPHSPLEGRWRDPQGHLLVVEGDRFMIARSAEARTRGRIHIENERLLVLQPVGEPQGRRYEYAVQDGKLALRDEQGNLLLFKKAEQ